MLGHASVAYVVGGVLIVASFVLGVTTRIHGIDGIVGYLDLPLVALGAMIAIWPKSVRRLIHRNELATADAADPTG